MSQDLFYLYKHRIPLHYGQDPGMTGKADILLTISNDWDKLLQYKERFEYQYYKFPEFHVVLQNKDEEQLSNFLGTSDTHEQQDLLERISFSEFKNLYEILLVDFTLVKRCSPIPQAYYPMFNHALLNSLGFRSLFHLDLDILADNLCSTDPDECFEKGLFFLLQNNSIAFFIGDPEITAQTEEFFERYLQSRKKMLRHFGRPANPSLISKHDCLKFWLIETSFRHYEDTFNHFFENKSEILGENLDHFNALVTFFKNHKEKLIYTLNVC